MTAGAEGQEVPSLPGLHDYEIGGIDLDRVGRVVRVRLVDFETVRRPDLALTLSGVSEFRLHGAGLQNVIFEATLVGTGDAEAMAGLPFAALGCRPGPWPDGSWALHLVPSAGAELICVFRELAVGEGPGG